MELSSTGWSIIDKRIVPSYEMCLKALQGGTENVSPDVPFTFEFHSSYSAKPVLINDFPLKSAGGPLAALTKQDFKEGKQRKVYLCREDCPVVFGIIRQFLHFAQVDLSQLNLKQIVQIAVSSHRWELRDLYHLIQKFIVDNQLINNFEDVISAKRIIDLRDSGFTFRLYFYRRCGENIGTRRHIENNSTGQGLSEIVTEGLTVSDVVRALEDEISGGLDDIWEMVIADGCPGTLVFYALSVAPKNTRRDISALVMLKVEPLIDCDEELTRILRFLLKFNEGLEELFNIPVVKKFASSRTIRLCSLFMKRVGNLANFSSGMRFSISYAVKLSESNQDAKDLWPFGQYSHFQVRLSWVVMQNEVEVTITICNQYGTTLPLKSKVFLWSDKCTCGRKEFPLRFLLSETLQDKNQDWRGGEYGTMKEFTETWKVSNAHIFSKTSSQANKYIEDGYGYGHCESGVYTNQSSYLYSCSATLHIIVEEKMP